MALDIGTLDKLLSVHAKLLGYPALLSLRNEINTQIEAMEADTKKVVEDREAKAKEDAAKLAPRPGYIQPSAPPVFQPVKAPVHDQLT